jgi:non-specific serine/threonine protein kinase
VSIEELAGRLESDLRLLATSERTADPRHATLHATIAWSDQLLTPGERTLFHRLSVFAGGYSLESIEAVCAGDGIQRRIPRVERVDFRAAP